MIDPFRISPTRAVPQAVDVEQALLGEILYEPYVLSRVRSIVKPESFYDARHRHIFRAICKLQDEDTSIDLVTVTDALRKTGVLDDVGGPSYVTDLSTKVVSAANSEYHARIILEHALKRDVIAFAQGLVSEAYEPETDALELLDRLQSQSMLLGADAMTVQFVSAPDAVVDVVNYLARISGTDGGITGVPTGFHQLDDLTAGWQNSDLIIIAARPSMGKTAFALSLARAAAASARRPTPTCIITLEMPVRQLMQRFLAMDAKIDAQAARRGRLREEDWTRITRSAGRISAWPLYFSAPVSPTISEVRARIRRLKDEFDIGLAIVDYLQLMHARGADGVHNREQEIAHIARSLKELAKEIDIPVIALSQLSRAVEQRGGDRRPQLSDLRECLPVDEWIYTSTGPMRLGDRPRHVAALGADGMRIRVANYVEKRYNDVYEVRSQYGTFRATPRHLVLTGTGWRQVRHLVPGRDVLASPTRIPHANRGPQPYARFLGWMLGNGGFSGTPSLIYRRELDAEVRAVAAQLGVEVRYRKTQKSDNVFDTYLSNGPESGSLANPVMEWLRSLGLEGKTCYDKSIPSSYLGSSDETHRELLRGFWEADGTVTRGAAKCTTVSEILARQIAWLLLTLGIRSTVNCYDGLWEVRVSRADNPAMQAIVDNAERFGELADPDPDYVDPAPAIFVELLHEISSPDDKRLQKRADGSFKAISRSRMAEMIAGRYGVSSISESPYMTLPEIGWGRIYSVEKLDKQARVADLQVPGDNNFVASGIVVHNSGSIEQDADVVAFIYRAERYGIKVDEDGNSLEGIAEIIVGKQRNGPTDTVRLAFVHEYALFENLAYGRWMTPREKPPGYRDPAGENFPHTDEEPF